MFYAKRKTITMFVLAAVLCAAAGVVSAQRGTSIVSRISFPRGRTTAVLRGSVHRGMSHDYLLRARTGQNMSVHLTSRGEVSFSVMSPGGQSLADLVTDWSGELPESGDFRINVLPPTENSRPAPYTLEVTIR